MQTLILRSTQELSWQPFSVGHSVGTMSDKSCKLCYAQLEDTTYFISLCPLLVLEANHQAT